MYSILNPNVIYQDTSPDVTEHDIDVVSDMWDIDGREVYRGARDPRYTHANVYWLYNEDLERVGCSEHSKKDQADFRVLWFRESEFGTLLQEDWTIGESIWSYFPRHVFERAINEGWTNPRDLLERCLHSPVRVLTWQDVVQLPMVYSCSKCGTRSLHPIKCGTEKAVLEVPDQSKVYFIDSDLMVHVPPKNSRIWFRMRQQHGDGSPSQEQSQQAPEQAQAHSESPPHVAPPLAVAPHPQPQHSS